jgi:hypothetical protein
MGIKAVAVAMQTPGCLAINWEGEPGIAKSARLKAVVETLGGYLEIIIASIREPADFLGLPVPCDGGGVRYEAPSWAHRLVEAGKTHKRVFLFLDEITTAAPAVQAALLRVVYERIVGELALPDNCVVICASNPPEYAAGGHDLSDPLANRLVHIPADCPSAEAWGEWITTGASECDDVPHVDGERFDDAFRRAAALVAGFLRTRPGMLKEDLNQIRGRYPMAYCTPRTWEAATRLHASCEVSALDPSETMLLISGAIGQGAATEFTAYVRNTDLIDPELILSGAKKFIPDPRRPDRTYAQLLSVASAAARKDIKKGNIAERWERAWIVIGETMGDDKSIGALPARVLAKNRPPMPKDNPAGGLLSPKVRKVVAELAPIVRDAGLLIES